MNVRLKNPKRIVIFKGVEVRLNVVKFPNVFLFPSILMRSPPILECETSSNATILSRLKYENDFIPTFSVPTRVSQGRIHLLPKPRNLAARRDRKRPFGNGDLCLRIHRPLRSEHPLIT